MIEALFSECGLSLSEQKVLLFLLERGARPASLIAKAVEIKRPTVYSVLENLISLGLVIKEAGQGSAYFKPVAHELIPKILVQKAKANYENVELASKQLGSVLEQVRKQSGRHFVDYSVLTLDSSEAAYAQLFEACTGGSGFCAIFNPQEAVNKQSKASVLNYLKLTATQKAKIREIAVAGPATNWYLKNINNKNHLVKTIPASKAVHSNMIMRDQMVVINHYSATGTMSIKINHSDFYQSMMTIFEMLWEGL